MGRGGGQRGLHEHLGNHGKAWGLQLCFRSGTLRSLQMASMSLLGAQSISVHRLTDAALNHCTAYPMLRLTPALLNQRGIEREKKSTRLSPFASCFRIQI